MKPNVGIAIFAGWMTQLGLSVLLPTLAIVIGRAAAMNGGDGSGWEDHAYDPRQASWHVTQGALFFASLGGAWLAGTLAPGRIVMSGAALVLLVMLAKVFEQLPRPAPASALAEWILAPCIGIIAGSVIARLTVRREPDR